MIDPDTARYNREQKQFMDGYYGDDWRHKVNAMLENLHTKKKIVYMYVSYNQWTFAKGFNTYFLELISGNMLTGDATFRLISKETDLRIEVCVSYCEIRMLDIYTPGLEAVIFPAFEKLRKAEHEYELLKCNSDVHPSIVYVES